MKENDMKSDFDFDDWVLSYFMRNKECCTIAELAVYSGKSVSTVNRSSDNKTCDTMVKQVPCHDSTGTYIRSRSVIAYIPSRSQLRDEIIKLILSSKDAEIERHG